MLMGRGGGLIVTTFLKNHLAKIRNLQGCLGETNPLDMNTPVTFRNLAIFYRPKKIPQNLVFRLFSFA